MLIFLDNMLKLFANCGDPDQTPHPMCALFAKYPFVGLQTKMGEEC